MRPDPSRVPAGITRRQAVGRLAGISMGALLVNCGMTDASSGPDGNPRLQARPGSPTLQPTLGLNPLGLGSGRDGLLYIPDSYRADTPLPLIVMLHGAAHAADEMMHPHIEQSVDQDLDMILLAVDSRFSTWDAVRGNFGPDVAFIDQALAYVFARCAVDPTRIVFAGFSDGASYALGLGRANGDLARKLVAYSPGMLMAVPAIGKPPCFITHGTQDTVLPVEISRNIIVPGLEQAGYHVEYREWDGGHGVSLSLLREAIRWMAA